MVESPLFLKRAFNGNIEDGWEEGREPSLVPRKARAEGPRVAKVSEGPRVAKVSEGVRVVAWQQCGNKVGMTSDKGRLLGSNRLEDRLASDAIRSCYATQPVSTGQKRPGLVTIKENRCLTMAHSHVYSWFIIYLCYEKKNDYNNWLKSLHVSISTAINLHKWRAPIFHKCSFILKSHIPTF